MAIESINVARAFSTRSKRLSMYLSIVAGKLQPAARYEGVKNDKRLYETLATVPFIQGEASAGGGRGSCGWSFYSPESRLPEAATPIPTLPVRDLAQQHQTTTTITSCPSQLNPQSLFSRRSVTMPFPVSHHSAPAPLTPLADSHWLRSPRPGVMANSFLDRHPSAWLRSPPPAGPSTRAPTDPSKHIYETTMHR